MEVFLIDPSRLVADIVGYVAELKSTFRDQQHPISDDDTTLQKLCVKLETVLRHEQKEKYTILGFRKDYWHFIVECIPKDDGIKYVQAVPQMKTGQGRGRAFIRYSLAHKTLGDAIQRLLVNKNSLSAWYRQEAVLRNPALSSALVNKLYDLNDVDFDLPCGGYDLDISWPAFSRRSFGEGSTTGRRSSVSSMSSVDFRNERPEPLAALSVEVTALKQQFMDTTVAGSLESSTQLDNVSISDQPSVSELTSTISQVNKIAMKWKMQRVEEMHRATREIKKAHDDREFAIKESELNTKQIIEKYSLLAKTASEESETKCKGLIDKLSLAEKALAEREKELKELKSEINQSVVSLQNAQRETIAFEKQLTSVERKNSELNSENEDFKNRMRSKELQLKDLESSLQGYKNRISKLETKELEYKDHLSEAMGNLKAKEVALESVQTSFEKLNGMVFGSFEELEVELKDRLMEREKGLQSQSLENRKLELNVVELQQQLRESRAKRVDIETQLKSSETEIKELGGAKSELQEALESKTQDLSRYERLMAVLEKKLATDGVDTSDGDDQLSAEQRYDKVVRLVDILTTRLTDITEELTQTLHKLDRGQTQLQENTNEIEGLRKSLSEVKNDLKASREDGENVKQELCAMQDRLISEASSQESLRSELSLVNEQMAQNTDELSSAKEENRRLSKMIIELENSLDTCKAQLEDVQASKESLVSSLSSTKERAEQIENEKKALEELHSGLEEEISTLREEKAFSSDEVDVAKQQLEAANEGRIRAEHAQLKVQDELESLRCTMEQEVAALKFQLSSETMKYETEIKVLSAESQEITRYKERMAEQDDIIADLESKLKERGDTWLSEKRKYTNEIKHLRTEVQMCKSGLDGHKQKVMSLENDLLLTTKQLGKEQSRQEDMNRKVSEIEEQSSAREERLKARITEVERDSRELKDRLISLTQEKSDLWRKADDMAHEIKVKASDRWIADEEVKCCTDCKAEFSFLLRRHHCRMCGRIFCHACANNWVRTPHSRKLKRVCNYCLLNDKQIRRTDGGDYETMSDVSADETRRSASMLSATSDDDMRDSPNHTYSGDSRAMTSDEGATVHGQPAMASTPEESPDGSHDTTDTTAQDSTIEYRSLKSVEGSSVQARANSPEGEGFEVIDPHDDMEEQPDTRVIIGDSDSKAELAIPAVNDEEGVVLHEVVPAGLRYVLPVMAATPDVTLCWTFSTVNKSVIFGVAYKHSENTPDDDLETILPLSRYASHQTPVEGDWKVISPGVYLFVFDNTFSRFTSKQLTCEVKVKRRTSLLKTDTMGTSS